MQSKHVVSRHVTEREGERKDLSGIDRSGIGPTLECGHDRSRGEQRSLGRSRGARREQEPRRCVEGGAIVGAPLLCGRELGTKLQDREVSRDVSLEARRLGWRCHKSLRPRAFDLRGELSRREAVVQEAQDSTVCRDAIVRGHPIRMVLADDGHDTSSRCAGASPGAELFASLREIGEGPGLVGDMKRG